MATKVKEEELFAEQIVPAGVVNEPLVHTMIRTISSDAFPQGQSQFVHEVDADVSSWVERGYRLVNTHYLGQEVEGYIVMYVLSK